MMLFMETLKNIRDLPEGQQKILVTLLKIKTPTFRTSEVVEKLTDEPSGRSVGGVLGSLYRNGYLEKVSGGRDKTWKLSAAAVKATDEIQRQLSDIKRYWS